MQTLYFCHVVSSFFFFLAQSQPSQTGYLPYLHTWCGLSANLGWRSETCCTWLTENIPVGHKKSRRIRHLGTRYIFGGSFTPWRNFTRCKIENSLCPSLPISYNGSVTAQHSSSGRQEGATNIQLSGHRVRHRPTYLFTRTLSKTTLRLKKNISPLQLAIIFTYTVRLRQFLG